MQAAGGNLGELWVTYEIEFYKPKYNSGLTLYTDHFNLNDVTTADPLGSTTLVETKRLRELSTNPNWENSGMINQVAYMQPSYAIRPPYTTYIFPELIQDKKFLVVYSLNISPEGDSTLPALVTENCTTVQYWQADLHFDNYFPKVSGVDTGSCQCWIIMYSHQVHHSSSEVVLTQMLILVIFG